MKSSSVGCRVQNSVESVVLVIFDDSIIAAMMVFIEVIVIASALGIKVIRAFALALALASLWLSFGLYRDAGKGRDRS